MTIPAWWAGLKHFKPEECDSPDEPGSGAIHMDETFMRNLDAARDEAGIPFVLTSAYRSRAHNIAVGGAADSDHMSGRCVDIAVLDKATRFKVIKACMANGMTQFGIGDRIVHVGQDFMRTDMVGIYHPGISGRWF